jgi:hypothetical protein
VSMNRSVLHSLLITFAGAALLSGCETFRPLLGMKPSASAPAPAHSAKPAPARPAAAAPSNPPPPAPQPSTEQQALKDGIELYNKGSYNEAIKRLAAPEIASGSKAGQIAAAKFSAFSYCVSARPVPCRQQFEKAFKLDPAFDLQPGEHGHPLWGPQFAKAKKAR